MTTPRLIHDQDPTASTILVVSSSTLVQHGSSHRRTRLALYIVPLSCHEGSGTGGKCLSVRLRLRELFFVMFLEFPLALLLFIHPHQGARQTDDNRTEETTDGTTDDGCLVFCFLARVHRVGCGAGSWRCCSDACRLCGR